MARLEYRWEISEELLDIFSIQKAHDNGGWELTTMIKTKDDNYVYYWQRPIMDSDLSKISDRQHEEILQLLIDSREVAHLAPKGVLSKDYCYPIQVRLENMITKLDRSRER